MIYRHQHALLRAVIAAGAPTPVLLTQVRVDHSSYPALHPVGPDIVACDIAAGQTGGWLLTLAEVLNGANSTRLDVCHICSGDGRDRFRAELALLTEAAEIAGPFRIEMDRLRRHWDEGDFDRPTDGAAFGAAWRLLWELLNASHPDYLPPHALNLDSWVTETFAGEPLTRKWASEQVATYRACIEAVTAKVTASAAEVVAPGKPERLVATRISPSPGPEMTSLCIRSGPLARLPKRGYPIFAVPVGVGAHLDQERIDLGPAEGWTAQTLRSVLPAADRLREAAPPGSPLAGWPQALATARDLGLGS